MLTGINKFILVGVKTKEEVNQVIELLQQQNLPVSDIDDTQLLFLLKDGDTAIGTAGLEVFDDGALVRSVSVIKEAQGKGYGKFIDNSLVSFAKENNIRCLYLLTTTAKDFFEKQGYTVISRDKVPASIQNTTEFSSICPSSAFVMKKETA